MGRKCELICRLIIKSGDTVKVNLDRLSFKVRKWSVQRLTRLEEEQAKLSEEQNMMEELLQWIDVKEGILIEKENEPIPDDDYEEVMKLLDDHKGFQEEMAKKQPTYDRLTKSVKRRSSVAPAAAPAPVTPQPTPEHKQGRRGSKIPKLASPASSFTRERSREKLTSPGSSFTRSGSTSLDKNHPALLHLSKRWQHLWLLSMERLRRLQEKLERIAIVSKEFILSLHLLKRYWSCRLGAGCSKPS